MNDPLVSVVIPSFNHARYIGRAIQSLSQQTYPHWELLIVDDGSSDDSVNLIRSELYRAGIQNARLLVQENSGAHTAINRGISEARGDYISILNSDDAYHPERLSRVIGAMQRHGARIAGSEVSLVHEDDSEVSAESGRRAWYESALIEAHTYPTLGFALLISNLFLTSSNFVIDRSILESPMPFSAGRFAHDWGFLLRSLLHTEPLMLSDRLLSYRLHDKNTWLKGRQDTAQEVRDILSEYFSRCEEPDCRNERRPSIAVWGQAFSAFLASRQVLGFDMPLSSLCHGQGEGTLNNRTYANQSSLDPGTTHDQSGIFDTFPDRARAIDPEFKRIPWQRRLDIYRFLPLSNVKRLSTVIFGAGSGGAISLRKLPMRYRVVAFVDSDKNLQGRTIHGIPIQPPEWLVQHQWDIVLVSSSQVHGIRRLLEQLSIPSAKILYDVPPN